MFAESCAAVDDSGRIPVDLSARIELSGGFAAQCAVCFPSQSARNLTNAFLESQDDWDDGMLADSVGEMCNLIAGGWKRRLGEPAWGADLSVPTLCRGREFAHPCDSIATLRRHYAFNGSPFAVSIVAPPATGSPHPAASGAVPYFTTDWNKGEVSRLANSLSDEE